VPGFDPPPPGAREALAGLGRYLDERMGAEGATRCRACGRCCDFPRAGHVLFGAKIELDVLVDWIRRDLSLDASTVADRLARGQCPAWQRGLCGARPARLLGCRLYYCDGAAAARAAPLARACRRRLTELSAHHGVPWWYGPALAYMKRHVAVPAVGAAKSRVKGR
jgi:hypothetical protein